MNLSKSLFSLLLSFSCLVSVTPLRGDNQLESIPVTEERDAFDDLLAFADTPEVSNIISNSAVVNRVQRSSKQSILVILNSFGVIPLLQENFFLRSNNLKSRNLLDYPEFLPFRHDCDCRAVYVDLFYNQTSRGFFTKQSGNICSYLAVGSESLNQKIQNIIDSVRETNEDVVIDTDQLFAIIDLASTFTVQERRLGLMIGGKGTIGCWNYNIMAPWYYLERNHFVDSNVEEALDRAIADFLRDSFNISGPASPEEAAQVLRTRNSFINQHLISDKFGIGDTRVYFDYPIIDKEKFQSRGGFLATIPTAFAMRKGLRGNSLSREVNRPVLDIVGLFDSILQGNNLPTQSVNYLLTALDNLGAILLDTPMGNGGHLGLGLYVKNRSPLNSFIKQSWAENVIMRSFISLEYLFPATEWRSFRVPVNEALFNARNFNVLGLSATSSEDQNLINNTYEFVQRQLTDRLIPVALQAKVNPGVIFRWSSQLCYEGECNGFTIGTDTYVRNKEKFSSIDATSESKRMLDILNARSPLAYQSKAVASVFFKVEKPETSWVISIIGDYTFMNKGIGADFTLALNTNVAF